MPLDTLRDKILDMTPYACEERYRFIDCRSLVNDRTLKILETRALPPAYSTISYVWLGLSSSLSALQEDGSFRVYCGTRSDGIPKEDGGPISMKVLEFACLMSAQSSASYLWLDRLCILQTSLRDKHWQINRMYDIYEGCQECFVLPGGLQRLASVFDETTWADRAWTYQEAIITWEYALVLTCDWHKSIEEQHWLVEGKCHWQYLHQLFLEGGGLLSAQTIKDNAAEEDGPEDGLQEPRLILGRNGPALDILRRIMEYKSFNHLCEEGEEAIDEQIIGQLVLQGVQMRVSSRPVDMVLSILGLVGVQEYFSTRLGDFEQNERFHATLALVEALLRREAGDGDEGEGEGRSTLVDVPLWATLERNVSTSGEDESAKGQWIDQDSLPSLRELAEIFDGALERPGVPQTSEKKFKVVPLPEWHYGVTLNEDDPEGRAIDIARKIPEMDLMRAYHGEKDRIILEHEDEGIIELCKTLDLKRKFQLEEEFDSLCELFVFGWSLRLQGPPYIRFYKLDVSSYFR